MKKKIVALAVVPMIGISSIAASETKCTTDVVNPKVLEALECLVNEKVDEKFANTILMTNQECAAFGNGWKPFKPMSGRFPLAAGRGRDGRDETIGFTIGDMDGNYNHQLIVAEMPAHNHYYRDRVGRGIRADYGDDEPTERRDERRKTESRGGGKPHNNMPPYFALNFCHKP